MSWNTTQWEAHLGSKAGPPCDDLRFCLQFFNVYLFLRERERESMGRGEAEREGDTESEAGSRLRAVSAEPDAGLELMNREIMTWVEVGCFTD